MQRQDLIALLASTIITGLMIWGTVYFVNVWWERLPKAVALIICMVLAFMVIGYPIYALAKWSDRYLVRTQTPSAKSDTNNP